MKPVQLHDKKKIIDLYSKIMDTSSLTTHVAHILRYELRGERLMIMRGDLIIHLHGSIKNYETIK